MQFYSSFEEKGYKFEAYTPSVDQDTVAFEIRISINDQLKATILVPMSYVPTFGVDVDDVHYLESVADRIIQLLPEASDFGEQAITALDQLETEIGGKAARSSHSQWLKRRSEQREGTGIDLGQFEYTGDLFEAKVADVLGNREAAGRWMKTKASKLGDRTPEEALRLGMGPEVVNYLIEFAHLQEQ